MCSALAGYGLLRFATGEIMAPRTSNLNVYTRYAKRQRAAFNLIISNIATLERQPIKSMGSMLDCGTLAWERLGEQYLANTILTRIELFDGFDKTTMDPSQPF